ncbi:transporter, divalent anion:Na+ symporter (DASS) family [Cedecea neteri]|uniref:Transporter, divalent anion:Na+ symporter (DASS) family n=1 Tax=Cedecea neteri TaxID=158822 RepID=A0A2X2V692_9ENTR|nr:transporter, divalent anion:Na+ symporter (DASS) family [Cedecea neteri]
MGGYHRRMYHQLNVPFCSGPNLLALALVKSIVGINISWGMWFLAFLPLGLLLLLTMRCWPTGSIRLK